MKIGEYEQMMSYMARQGLKDGTILPRPKPEGRTFQEKLTTLKKAAQGLTPGS